MVVSLKLWLCVVMDIYACACGWEGLKFKIVYFFKLFLRKSRNYWPRRERYSKDEEDKKFHTKFLMKLCAFFPGIFF
jgi:hypothetical protein